MPENILSAAPSDLPLWGLTNQNFLRAGKSRQIELVKELMWRKHSAKGNRTAFGEHPTNRICHDPAA